MEFPCYSIQYARETVLADSPAKQRVRSKGPECVVSDFSVGGRGALAYQVEVGACGERRRVEQDEPDVDAEFGLQNIYVSIENLFEGKEWR